MTKAIALISLFIGLLTGSAPTQQATARNNPQLEAEAMKLLDEYMSAWNRKDLAAWLRAWAHGEELPADVAERLATAFAAGARAPC